jgi:C-terminal processing protease CtpA/Prc
LTGQIELRLPVARSINPVTGGNWEGVGVQPDISVPAPDALDVARKAALEMAHALE